MPVDDQQESGSLPRTMELARQSYKEVLDAIKHQDDKINRFLVAIAFLTTGGVAFLLKPELLHVRYVYGNQGVPLIAIAAGIYLAATITSVVLLLMALSTELKLPGAKPRASEDVKLDDSLLYFHMIGGQPLRMWLKRWDAPVPALEERLRGNYLREAHNLSERARVKYSWTNEASAVYIYALMWLAVGLLLGTHLFQLSPALAPGENSPLAVWPLLITGVVFAGHALLQLHNVYRQEQSSPDVDWHRAVHRLLRANSESRTPTSDERDPTGRCALRESDHAFTGHCRSPEAVQDPTLVSRCAAYLADPGRSAGPKCALRQAADEGEQLEGALRALTRLMLCVPLYILCAEATAVTQGWGALAWELGVAASSALLCWFSWTRIKSSRKPPRLAAVRLVIGFLLAVGLPFVSAVGCSFLGALAAAAGPATLLSLFTVSRYFHKSRERQENADKSVLDFSDRRLKLVELGQSAASTPSGDSSAQEVSTEQVMT